MDNLIVHNNKVYTRKESELYDTFTECEVAEVEPTAQWKGAKIPFTLWQEMVEWCQVTQNKFKSEALCFLYLDRGNAKYPWQVWYPPQRTQGMTVQSDPDNPQYAIQRKNFPDLQFGTLHHHCTSSAFASGTDHADEIDREGLHFTIGKLGEAEHDIDYRFCIEGQCYKGNIEDVVEMLPEVAALPAKYAKAVHRAMLKEPVEIKYDWKEELKNVKKTSFHQQKWTTPAGGKIGGGYGTQSSFEDVFEQDETLPLTGTIMSHVNENKDQVRANVSAIISNITDIFETYPEATGITNAQEYYLQTPSKKVVDSALSFFQSSATTSPAAIRIRDDLTCVALEWTGYDISTKTSNREELYAAECYKYLQSII